MTSKATLKAALSIAKDGAPTRAGANNFGDACAQYGVQLKLYKWALRVLERRSCGARRRRDGLPCNALNEAGSSRCRWYGGCSTGPKTAAGKAKAVSNLRQFRQASPRSAKPSDPSPT